MAVKGCTLRRTKDYVFCKLAQRKGFKIICANFLTGQKPGQSEKGQFLPREGVFIPRALPRSCSIILRNQRLPHKSGLGRKGTAEMARGENTAAEPQRVQFLNT